MKCVVITGGSSGIGRAMAERFGREGRHVILSFCRHQKEAEEVKRSVTASGGVCELYRADFSNPEEVQGFAEFVLKTGKTLDVLIHNAGISHYGLMGKLSEEEYERVMNTNLKSAFLLTNALVPRMIQAGKGKIITVASIWGLVGASMESVYAASKAGLIGMTKSLSKELGPSGITVNCIAPGVIETPMMAGFDQETLDALKAETPLMRLGKPEEVASLACFLSSEEADFITGQVIAIDGGFALS